MTVADPLAQLKVNSCAVAPTPTNYSVIEVFNGTQRFIVVKLDTPSGSLLGWFDADHARRLATQLQACATGLSVVGDPINNGRKPKDDGTA